MDISFAFGSFILVIGACALAARRPRLRPVRDAQRARLPGEPGFLRRVAS